MSRLTEFERRIKQYAAAAETAGALQDVNAIRMQSIRRRFEKNHAFFDEIRALYGIVRGSAEREEEEEKKAPAAAPRALYVAVTANRRFAGTLTHDTIDGLVRELTKDPGADSLVIGRLGWQFLSFTNFARRSRQVVFEGETPTKEEFAALLTHIAHYERVYMLYGRFVNAFKQEVALQEITELPELTSTSPDTPYYLFEPELSDLRAFFDAQVRYVLLERVLLESDLARTAARFVTMEESRERASELLEVEHMRHTREKASTSNASLLEIFSGYARWGAHDHE